MTSPQETIDEKPDQNKPKNKKKNDKKKEKKKIKKQQVLSKPLGIPPEIFSSLISFLTTDQIATAMAVCRSWRIPIRDDFILHQDLDLSTLARGVEVETLLKPTFVRLSELARNKLVRVSLNMCPFWTEYQHQMGDFEKSFCQQFFRNFLFKSNKSLKHLSLQFLVEDGDGFDMQALDFVDNVVNELSSYPKLEKVYIEAPLATSFRVEGSSSKKVVEFVDNASEFELNWKGEPALIDYSFVHFISVSAAMFVGHKDYGITDYAIKEAQVLLNYDDREEECSVFNTLVDSTKSLKHLDWSVLRIYGRDLWEFGLRCTNLLSWKLRLYRPEEGNATMHLDVPEGVELNSNLKKLDLESFHYTFDWKSVLRWIGNNLEELSLSEIGKGEMMRDSTVLQSILKTYADSLRSLKLLNIHFKVAKPIKPIKKVKTFSNLKSLRIKDVDPSIYQILKIPTYPHLDSLSISFRDYQQEAFDCFLILLKANSSRLKSIVFNYFVAPAPEVPSEKLKLDFPVLEELDLGTSNEYVGRWLLGLSEEFPNLRIIESTRVLREKFYPKAPLLPRYKESYGSSDENSSDFSEDEDDDYEL